VSLSFSYALALGAVLVCCGAFAAGWRRDRGGALTALPLLTAGAAICLAGVSRFAANRQDPDTGQELAALVAVAGLAAVILGAAWSGRGAAR
jgi:hypothetical protein